MSDAIEYDPWSELHERPSFWPQIKNLDAQELDHFLEQNEIYGFHPAIRRRWREIARAIPPGGRLPDTAVDYSLYSWNETPQPKRASLSARCNRIGHDWAETYMGTMCRRCRKWHRST